MTDVISDYIALAVETLLSAVILASMLSLYVTTQQLYSKLNEKQVVQFELNEYRQYNQYDEKSVYQADIVSVIYTSRGLPAVSVKSSYGIFVWSTVSASTAYKAADISAKIDPNVKYHSSLVYGTAGEVIGYEFIAE